MRRAIVLALLAGICLTAAAASPGATKEAWYWAPGFCKSQLTNYSLQIGSGPTARKLASTAAVCVGRHNRCWLHNGVRQYKVFDVTILAQDDVVRKFTLNVTGKLSWRGTPLRIVARDVTPGRFAATYGPQAHAEAVHENALGCDDPSYG